MTTIKSHFVFATGSAYSHTQPVINLVINLVSLTPDLGISIILHKNNESVCQTEIDAAPGDVAARIKLYPVGEKTAWKDASGTYMTMVYHSGAVYGAILATPSDWPIPCAFIFDITSFFYVQVKLAVEANFPHIKAPSIVGYMPESTAEILYHVGSIENGSLRWVDEALDTYDPELKPSQHKVDLSKIGNDQAAMMREVEKMRKLISVYQNVVTNSERVVEIPGNSPFQLFERWGIAIDWADPKEAGWFQFLSGLQATALACQAWITCFPSSILEPEALDAAKVDTFIANSGKKPFTEMGWFDPLAVKPLGEGVGEFLDKFSEKEVVYISFGTIVEAGAGLLVLLEVLKTTKTPFIYACQGVAPEWVDQVGVLRHKSTMCFISHCGVNSVMEGIMSATPIICWARRWDQTNLSALVGTKGLGIELLQHRSGVSVRRKILHSDVKVEGTPEALRAELVSALELVKGERGEEIRGIAEKVGGEIRAKRKGVWEENVKKFGQFGRY